MGGVVAQGGMAVVVDGSMLFHAFDQFGAEAAGAGGHHDEGDDLALRVLLFQLRHRPDKQIDTFVMKLIATAVEQQQCIVADGLLKQAGGHLQQFGAGGGTFLNVLLPFRHKVVLKTVDGDDIGGLLKEGGALLVGDLAHGAVGIGMAGRQRLQREFRLHPEAVGGALRVVLLKVAVERQTVTSDAAPQHSGVRGEHRSHLRTSRLEVQDAATRHPLVEVSHNVVHGRAMVLVETLNHLAGCIAEQQRLHIVPLATDRIQLVVEPEVGENFVLLFKEGGKIHQHDNRAACHTPAPHADAQSGTDGRLAPGAVQIRRLLKIAVATRLVRNVGSDADIIVMEMVDGSERLGGQNCINTTYFVTNFPAGFKYVIGLFHRCKMKRQIYEKFEK